MEDAVPVGATDPEGRHLSVALLILVWVQLCDEDRVEGRVVQVGIQDPQMDRRSAHVLDHYHDALVHGHGCRAALQVAEVGLAAGLHQGLQPGHLDLHLSDSADLDGVAERGARAVALPDGRLRRNHPGLAHRTPDALLLRRPVGGRQAGTSAILTHLRPSQEGPPLVVVVAGLQHEARRAIAAIVAVGSGVEGEATAAG
mmetsp:Transcript_56032/g.126293  ORF Transcript_56032/g.126293 Transcript_56032/m.126293 type:complete len:200 (+) Transcript_56032:668-1267(+)